VSGQSQGTRAVVAVAVSSCNTYVGTILERFEGVLLFACDMVERQLSLLQKVLWSENAPPTSLSFDSGGNLWLVSGAAETVEMGDEFVTPEALAVAQVQAQGIAMAAVTHVQVVRDCVLLGGTSVPGGELLLHTLQGHQAGVQDVTAATEAAELAMKNLLSKRQYTAEQREHRKRMRNDKVVSLAS
jgi:tRNA (guanine-N(7)-)-methyltransferase subunit TRM82